MPQFDYVKKRREDVDEIPNQAIVHWLIKIMTVANVWVFKASKGRLWKNFPGGYPICIVETMGRKSAFSAMPTESPSQPRLKWSMTPSSPHSFAIRIISSFLYLG